jgi:gamma-glutamyl:cysteine ligase YbdK (ATP-grasp superfamily)
MLHYPIVQINHVKAENETWRDTFFRLVDDEEFDMSQEEVNKITEMDAVAEVQTIMWPLSAQTLEERIVDATENLAQMMNTLTSEQADILNYIIYNPSASAISISTVLLAQAKATC